MLDDNVQDELVEASGSEWTGIQVIAGKNLFLARHVWNSSASIYRIKREAKK